MITEKFSMKSTTCFPVLDIGNYISNIEYELSTVPISGNLYKLQN